MNVKRFLKILVILAVSYFALKGLYGSFLDYSYNSVRKFVEQKESSRVYNKDLMYLENPNGYPIMMVNPSNKKTLFFVEGFRGAVGIAIYKDWLEKIHIENKVNIIGPIVGLQGWPFAQRNREWHYQEDMRQSLQIYDAYTANLPPDHRIIIATQSFGALSNATIMAFGKRSPDASVLMSPFNSQIEYKSGGAVVKWLATKRRTLQYIMPYMTRKQNPERASYWDIVNNENNIDVWEKTASKIMSWEENMHKGIQLDEAAAYMEKDLLPQIHDKKIVIIYGDEDLYLGKAGFENLAAILKKSGNTVQTIELKKTGHMLLFDNEADKAKAVITGLIDNTYKM